MIRISFFNKNKLFFKKSFLVKNSNKPYHNLCLLCSLIVPLLVTGPFLPDLLVISLSIWFLYYSIKNKIYKYYNNKIFLAFLTFCIICIISSLQSENILLSFESSLIYFRIGIFACLISYLIDKNKIILKYFYYSFSITFLALIIDGYYQFIFGFNIVGQDLIMAYTTPRVTSFFGDETLMDSYLARLFPLYFSLFVIKKNKKPAEIWLLTIIFILLDVLIYLGGGRTSFFFLNLSTIFIIFFINSYKKLRLLTFIMSVCIISVLTYNDNRLLNRFVVSPIKSMGITDEKKYIFTEGHDSHIRTAFKMFLDNPFLGVGPKLFRVKCKDEKYAVGTLPCSTHPHNFYVQLLGETGLAGFLFIISALFFLIFKVLQSFIHKLTNKKKKLILTDYQICLISAFLVTLWPFSPNGNFFNNFLMIVYALPVGFFKKGKLKF